MQCCHVDNVTLYSPIDPEEKEAVRSHLLAGLEEPVNQVRSHETC